MLRGQRIDITGQRFGRLVALRYEGPDARRKNSLWRYACDCGGERVASANSVKDGSVKGCRNCFVDRCRANGSMASHPRRGGKKARSAERNSWRGMRYRCHNENDKEFHNYGARGITVCNRWRKSFAAFLADIGPRPSPKHSLDRIDVNGHYSCGKCDDCAARGLAANCRWATPKEQCRNTRFNRNLTLGGVTRCVAEWAEITGISAYTISGRVARGWNDERILTTPARAMTRRAA